jgi:hypothetical protein
MCADIHDGRERNAPFKGPNTDARDQLSSDQHIRLATHGRSIQMCHKPTHVVQQKNRYSITSSARASSGSGKVMPRALAVLRLNDQLQLRGLLDRQVGRLLAIENTAGIDSGHLKCLCETGPVADQSSGSSELAILVYRWNGVPEQIDWSLPERQTRAVAEFLTALDDDDPDALRQRFVRSCY